MIPRPRIVAIIPARGGSKGIKGKNLASLAGRPLLAYTVDAARRAPEIDDVLVSTDSDEIAAFAETAGATVVRRPAGLSGDTAASESALLHALDDWRLRHGGDPDLVVFLQATSPLRPAEAVSGAIQTLLAAGADSLFSASSVHGFVWRLDGDRPESVSYDYRRRPRRQDAVKHFEENGSIYVFRPWVLRRTGNRLGGRIAMYPMDWVYAIQIDEPGDLSRVERLMAAMAGHAE